MGIHTEGGKEYLVFGNGLGTTHSTVSRALGEMDPRIKPSPRDGLKYQGINGGTLILYDEDGRVWINGDSWSMSEKTKPEEVSKYMKEPAKYQFKELVRLIRENKNLL